MKKYSYKKSRGESLSRKLGEEAQIQIALMKYIQLTYKHKLLAVHVPNDLTRSPAEGYVKKMMGMMPGFPDLIIFKKNGGFLLLELKTEIGKLSHTQKTTHNLLRQFGLKVRTTWGIDQAIKQIDLFANE